MNETPVTAVAGNAATPVIEQKVRKPRTVTNGPLVVGSFNAVGVFTPNIRQPTPAITEMADMLAWAKKEFASMTGKYQFIRIMLGGKSLTIAPVTTTSATVG